MNQINIKVEPVTTAEVKQLIEILKRIIKEGNGILKFFEKVSSLETETPVDYETLKCQSPTQNPTVSTMFSTSPIKSRKSSAGMSPDKSIKFNNTKVLSFVKYSLLMKFQVLIILFFPPLIPIKLYLKILNSVMKLLKIVHPPNLIMFLMKQIKL